MTTTMMQHQQLALSAESLSTQSFPTGACVLLTCASKPTDLPIDLPSVADAQRVQKYRLT